MNGFALRFCDKKAFAGKRCFQLLRACFRAQNANVNRRYGKQILKRNKIILIVVRHEQASCFLPCSGGSRSIFSARYNYFCRFRKACGCSMRSTAIGYCYVPAQVDGQLHNGLHIVARTGNQELHPRQSLQWW